MLSLSTNGEMGDLAMKNNKQSSIRWGIYVITVVAVGVVVCFIFLKTAIDSFEQQTLQDQKKVYRLAKAVHTGPVTDAYLEDAVRWASQNETSAAWTVRSYRFHGVITADVEANNEEISIALFQCYIAFHRGKGCSWDEAVRTYCGGPDMSGTNLKWIHALRKIVFDDV
jgi:hypothetical protein